MTLLSVDPGNPCGWALWTARHHLAAYGLLDDADAGTITALLSFLADEVLEHPEPFNAMDEDEARLVIEGQWFQQRAPATKCEKCGHSPKGREHRGAPFGSVAKVIESRCRWEDACTIAGMTTEVVSPARWIPAMTKGHPERDTTKRVHAVCLARYPMLDGAATKDETAAVLLGAYAIETAELGHETGHGGPIRRGLCSEPPRRFKGLQPARRQPKGER